MSDLAHKATSTRHYFVDEAGDGTLFDGKGRVIIGGEGCSRFFILGFVDIPNPVSLTHEMSELRATLLADPYFRGIPSMQPDQRKTALAFHAKDDVAEVRREVFSLLRRHTGIRFFAVVKDKRATLDYVLSRNEREPRYRYEPNELYDHLVRRLFKNMLHKDDAYDLYFARRGKSDRMVALNLHSKPRANDSASNGESHRPRRSTSLPVPHRRNWDCRRRITSFGPCSGFTSAAKTVTLPISGPSFIWFRTLMTHARPGMASITHRKSR